MKSTIPACILVLTLGGCAVFDDPVNKLPDLSAADFSRQQEADIKAGVIRLVGNPRDATFSEMAGAKAGQDFYVCGKVTSRANFIEGRPFLIKMTGSTVEPVAIGGADYQDKLVVALCHQYGIN